MAPGHTLLVDGPRPHTLNKWHQATQFKLQWPQATHLKLMAPGHTLQKVMAPGHTLQIDHVDGPRPHNLS